MRRNTYSPYSASSRSGRSSSSRLCTAATLTNRLMPPDFAPRTQSSESMSQISVGVRTRTPSSRRSIRDPSQTARPSIGAKFIGVPSQRQPAIDDDGLAGDHRRAGAQEEDYLGDVLGLAGALQGRSLDRLLFAVGRPVLVPRAVDK